MKLLQRHLFFSLPNKLTIRDKSAVKKRGLPLPLVLCMFWTCLSFSASAYNINQFVQERADFQVAMAQLTNEDKPSFQETLKSLEHYPLFAYLEYESIDLTQRQLPEKQVRDFIEKYKGEPIASRMKVKWLNQLVKRHEWQRFVEDWDPAIKGARLNCWYLRSLYRTGQKTKALAAVEPLWLQARSQPKACDPLFKEWIAEGYLTQEVAWQRFNLAMKARQTRLASYIARKLLTDEYQALAQSFLKVHRRPHTLESFKEDMRFLPHPEKVKALIVHGVKRLARKDAGTAQRLWMEYNIQHGFSAKDKQTVELALALAVAAESAGSDTARLEQFYDAPIKAIEERIRVALRETDWPAVFNLIQSMPEQDRSQHRWQYWLARSVKATNLSGKGLPTAEDIFSALSQTRSFYGFLAADILGVDYAMQDQPAVVEQTSIDALVQSPGLIRAMELFALNRRTDARREWWHGTKGLDANLLLAAGKVAEDFGWHEKAIRAYIKAQYWNDLSARFPLAYQSKMLDASKAQQLDMSWLYAIARQESAFSPDARSHAGAMGLMQLMPSTAKQTAQQIGLKIKRNDLLQPETNIDLGSNYLKKLLKQFNGNRILATTAYNAGPHRVKRWLKNTRNNLPFDVWIETIPFKETRSYVQNVLAFSVIYDYRMDQERQLVTDFESEQLL